MALGAAEPHAGAMSSLTAGEVVHVDPSALSTIDHIGILARVVLPGEVTGGNFAVVEQRGRLGFMTPRHLHTSESETFIVLEGALEGWCEGKSILVEAGQVLHLPANREHAFRVASDRAHHYIVVSPGGFEEFYPATGTVLDRSAFDEAPPLQGPVSPEKVDELAAWLAPRGASITGPPPFVP
jgi:quercetin dioxygenase-like cupin family protein